MGQRDGERFPQKAMLGVWCGADAEPLHKARRPMPTAEQGLCPGPSGARLLPQAGRGHGAILPFSIYTMPGRRPDTSPRGPRPSCPACLFDVQRRPSWPFQHADRSTPRSPRQPETREWEDNRNQAQPSKLQMRSKKWAYSAEAAGAKTKEYVRQPDKDGPKVQGEQSAKEGSRNDRRKPLPDPNPKPKPDPDPEPEPEHQGASKEAIGSAEAADPQRLEARQDGSESDDGDSNGQEEQEEEEDKNLKDDDDSKEKEDKYGKEKNDDNSKVEEEENPKNENGEGKDTKGKDPKENNSKVEEDNPKDDDDGKVTKGKNPKEKENTDDDGKVNGATAGSQQQSNHTQENIPTVYMQPFTPHQLRELEKVFYVNPSPSYVFRNDLARRLNVAEGRIKVWFKNRRARLRRMRDLPNHSTPGSQNVPVVITLGRNCRVSVVPQPGQPGQPGQPWMRPNETPLAAVPAQHLQVPPAPVYSPACPPPYSMMPPPPASYVLAPPSSAMAPLSPLLAPPMQSPVPRVSMNSLPMYVPQYPPPPPPPSGPTWFPNVHGPNYYSFQ